ncbi:non-homologous end-joining DNA ligase [Bacillus tianshenii]|nr:non-homologous end-joining DNA ligase [Bacillus tianshenii]
MTTTVQFTNIDKVLWPQLQKGDYIRYLYDVAPVMLPFLENRLLTVKRLPNGIKGESFYQKNCPDYAPSFVQTHYADDNNYIICNDVDTLLWLGNQLAIEYHVPFQTIDSEEPAEIVFDLDPPSRDHFQLAVKAARLIKEVCDSLKLTSFVKTSGNKGLQVYLPLQENHHTYKDTRLFTQFIANYLTTKESNLFTTERLKKKRGQKLYVDYIQHAEGKTIIAPYSPPYQ